MTHIKPEYFTKVGSADDGTPTYSLDVRRIDRRNLRMAFTIAKMAGGTTENIIGGYKVGFTTNDLLTLCKKIDDIANNYKVLRNFDFNHMPYIEFNTRLLVWDFYTEADKTFGYFKEFDKYGQLWAALDSKPNSKVYSWNFWYVCDGNHEGKKNYGLPMLSEITIKDWKRLKRAILEITHENKKQIFSTEQIGKYFSTTPEKARCILDSRVKKGFLKKEKYIPGDYAHYQLPQDEA